LVDVADVVGGAVVVESEVVAGDDVVVGTGGKESEGERLATLQNCCASVSEEETWSGQFARMQATSSAVKLGLNGFEVGV
jgi:hypothetical protein